MITRAITGSDAVIVCILVATPRPAHTPAMNTRSKMPHRVRRAWSEGADERSSANTRHSIPASIHVIASDSTRTDALTAEYVGDIAKISVATHAAALFVSRAVSQKSKITDRQKANSTQPRISANSAGR